MTEIASWLEKPSVMLIILLAGLTAATVSNIGGREVAVSRSSREAVSLSPNISREVTKNTKNGVRVSDNSPSRLRVLHARLY